MRAALVLALLLGVITPPGVWQAAADAPSRQDASTAAMSAPAGAPCQLTRDSAKTSKTVSGGWGLAVTYASSLLLAADAAHPLAHASRLHAIAIDCPPLSPRPPPA